MKADIPTIRRPAIRPLDEWVDDFMRGFGLEAVDPAKPETLIRLRKYARSWMKRCLERTLWDLQRGAKRGMQQSLDFMFDPDHAVTVKRASKARLERHALKAQEHQKARELKDRERMGPIQ